MNSGRKRVLLLVPSLIHGGAQRVFSTLLRHLDRERFEVHLALLEAKGVFLADVPGDVVVHDLRAARTRYSLPSIVRVIWKTRPRTVLSTLVYANLTLLLAKPFLPRGTRVIVRESTDPATFFSQETRYPRLWEWMVRRLYRKADRVVCLSDAMLSELAEHFALPREKLVRIYNPVDTAEVRRLAAVGGSPFSGPGPHLVTVGRLSREKGTDVLMAAMPLIVQRQPDAQLVILGDGPLEQELREQAKKLGVTNAVSFAGFQQNPWRYLKHADLFILPSRYEGLPNALLEALALGTPVVASDCPGAVREIQNSEPLVHLVPPGNSKALADAILAIIGSVEKRSPVDQEAIQEGMARFSLEQVLEEYSRLF
ncbi:MAG TPA: glycosyltransferase [Candidatus Saccharimonadales bacterium]|jgi:glycosyltransferase involved in cell wall biosynthesis|nr:glycosyltransferase [Candidatus Saccharimonadales bacterium]